MKDIRISVIIPVYNLERYLADTLDSVICQTHKNLEIILVDDGSADGSLAIMQAYAERDSRIKVIAKENGGVSSARNAGLDAATGDYIGFVDGDDLIEPDMYEYMLDAALRYSADLVQCGVIKDGKSVFTPDSDVVICDKRRLFDKADHLLSGGVWCKLYRAECIKGVRFAKEYPIGEDLFYTLSALSTIGCAAFLSEAKYHYVTRPGSAINSTISERKLTSYDKMLREAIRLYAGDPAATRYLEREALRNYADMASKIVRSGDDSLSPFYKEIGKAVRKKTATVLFGRGLAAKMRIKLLLLAYADRLYRKGVARAHTDE